MRISLRKMLLACLVAGAALQGSAQAGTSKKSVVGAEYRLTDSAKHDATLAPCACGDCDTSAPSCCDAAPGKWGRGNGGGRGRGDHSLSCDDGCDSGYGRGRGRGRGRGCDDGCDSDCGSDDGLLGLGWLKKTDLCYDDFISPMTNPTYFEDPRNVSELRFIYANHLVPIEAGGGEINLFATQIRARLSEKLSLIVTKGGYMTQSGTILDDGWMGHNVGMKYNWYADPVAGILYSSGLTYELPVGSGGNFQRYGNGQVHAFTSHARRLGCNAHFITALGARLPMDENLQNRMMYWSNHLDYRVTKKVYAFTEVNWFNWLGSGNGPLNGIEGGDLFSLGSSNVTGNDIVTQGVGFKYKGKENRELGFVYEFPLTERRDVLQERLTVDYIIRY